MKNQIKIVKKSKVIYLINDVRIDCRRVKYYAKRNNARTALFGYFMQKNNNVDKLLLDDLICNMINRQLESFTALDENYLFIN